MNQAVPKLAEELFPGIAFRALEAGHEIYARPLSIAKRIPLKILDNGVRIL